MHISGTKTLSYRKSPNLEGNLYLREFIQQRKNYFTYKRFFDVVFSLLAIVFILSWFLPLVAILIKLSSRGPVFFVQKRVGFLGRSFNCIKFRTMVMNDEANSKQAMENDPRITRIGRFLRKSNIDEFPQFFNVLIGDMSIVGPRPHMYQDCNEFSAVVDNYKFRNLSKPGITGLAQIKGFRGPTKDLESIFRRYQWDAFYVRNANFWFDLRIIRKTAGQTISFIISSLAPHRDSQKEAEKKFYRRFLMQTRERLNSFF